MSRLVGQKSLAKAKHEEDGEAWLVSYADMMTLLFGFFVILYSFSQIDEDKLSKFGKDMAKALGGKVDKASSESEVGLSGESKEQRALQLLVAMFNLGESSDDAVRAIEKMAAGQTADSAMKSLEKDLKREAGATPGEVRRTGEDLGEPTIEIILPGTLLFPSGSEVLTAAAKKRIATVAAAINRAGRLVSVDVVGHTDSTPPRHPGRYPDNWALSATRAAAVAEVLAENGVPKALLRVTGRADAEPLFVERRADGALIRENAAKNRRVHIVVVKAKEGAYP
jgi:chemotaxis protein MotB